MICQQLDNHSMPSTNTSICPTVRNVSKGVKLDMCDGQERGRVWGGERERASERAMWTPPAAWVSLRLCMVIYVRHLNGSSEAQAIPSPLPLPYPSSPCSSRLCHAPLGIHKLFKQTLSAQTGAGFASDPFHFHGKRRCLSLINVWLCLLCPLSTSLSLSLSVPTSLSLFLCCLRFLLIPRRHFTCLAPFVAIMSKVFGYLSI